MKDEIWTIEYDIHMDDCLDKRSWYVGQLKDSINANCKKLLMGGITPKWIIVGYSNSRDGAESLRDSIIRSCFDEWNKEC